MNIGNWTTHTISSGAVTLFDNHGTQRAVIRKGRSRNATWSVFTQINGKDHRESTGHETPEEAAMSIYEAINGKPRRSVPNRWVAEKTGYSESGVSRMRIPGDREPTLDRMRQLETVFGWELCDQINLGPAEWVTEFERVVSEAYDRDQ